MGKDGYLSFMQERHKMSNHKNKYLPHQGEKEKARRRKQMAKQLLKRKQ